jgi:hypothetical protein
VENGSVLFQLKATDVLKKSADSTVISIRLEWRDVLFWANELDPVILIRYDAREDKAYWLYVQEYFRRVQWPRRSGKASTVTVYIPADNVLDEAAIRRFARFRNERRRRR